MSKFSKFRASCKMRHDFADQIQVRYRHNDGEEYDTWVSGEEVLARVKSAVTKKRLQGISQLNLDLLKEVKEEFPKQGKEKLRLNVRNRAADEVENLIGGNVIGDSLADAVRGRERIEEGIDPERIKWKNHLQDEVFQAMVLELAWIQLEGSFTDTGLPEDPDDWV